MELIQRPVKLIRARMRDDVDLPSAGSSHVGGVTAGLNLEFLYRVGRGTQILRIERGIGIRSSVEQKIVSVGAITSNHYSRALPWAPIKRIGRSGLRAESNMGTGHGEYKIDQHASI